MATPVKPPSQSNSQGLGQLWVETDSWSDFIKVGYVQKQVLNAGIAMDLLHKAYHPEMQIDALAKQMSVYFYNDIKAQLMKHLGSQFETSPKPVPWHPANKDIFKAMVTPEAVAPNWDEMKALLGVTPTAPPPGTSNVVASLSEAVPGLKGARATCPVGTCGDHAALTDVIIHLNDGHRWSREEIADWLETLDYDLSFKNPEEAQPLKVWGLEDDKMDALSYSLLAAQSIVTPTAIVKGGEA